MVGMRDPFFFECMADVQVQLREVFGTDNQKTFPVPGTGSSGMEAAISNFVTPGAKVAIFANGVFADRQTEMARRHGAQVVRLEKEWGKVFAQEEAEVFIEREKPQTVAFVHGETSTGAYQAMRPITAAAKRNGAITIADCVTTLGAMPVEIDANEVDVAYSCTQKGLSCPSGLAPITISPERGNGWRIARARQLVSRFANARKVVRPAARLPPHAIRHPFLRHS